MTLKELQIGKSAIVDAVGGAGALRQHFLDMGLIPGVEVTLVKLAPMGDPMELRIHGYELTLRLDDAAQITVTPTEKTPAVHAPVAEKMVEHPGLGEGGKYHTKEGEHPLPEDKTLTFALAGNQNCGKTTLFNQLTGSNQHVGNFPGVTVDRKSGAIKGHPETEVTDLPGIYSMSPYSSEEIVTRQFIIGEKPTGIINIVDATNIERNLYLTMQLMELDIPMVLALNMMDEMRGNGGTVRINKMEAMLGIPVIPISAAKNEGVDELVDHAVHVAKYQERPGRMDFCSEDDHGGAVHRCIHGILHLIEDHAKAAGIPVRFAATKLVEGDPRIEEALKLDPNEKEMIEHIIVQMEQERGLDRAAAIADMRFSFIQELVAQTVVKPHESKEQLRSNRIDKFLTGKYTAIPAFIAIMGLVFFLTFNVIGLFFQNLMEMGIDALTGVVDTALTNWNVNAAVHSLVIDGIFTGVGSVLSFLPIIVVLFFFLSILEDTGYMARVAFVMDQLLRKIGLSGRSIVPMLVGFGCSVPAIMSTRTLASERDRRMTILLTPFMPESCEKLFAQIGAPAESRTWDAAAEWGALPETAAVTKGENLFPRLDMDKALEELEAAEAAAKKAALPAVEVEPQLTEKVDFDTFCKSDFRAVKVKACDAVKKSEKLLRFTLDDGTGVDRQILSGIHKWYEPEDLVGKTLIAIVNLPPRKMMGIDSCGMLISAVHTEKGEEQLNLLMIDDKIPAGAKMC